jgi:hypothetical protein
MDRQTKAKQQARQGIAIILNGMTELAFKPRGIIAPDKGTPSHPIYRCRGPRGLGRSQVVHMVQSRRNDIPNSHF